MICKHCNKEIPDQSLLCPECGEMILRESKKSTTQKADFDMSMPFLQAEATIETGSSLTDDPNIKKEEKIIKKNKKIRNILICSLLGIIIVGTVLYTIFLGGYKLAVYRYVKGIDHCSGSTYLKLAPDSFEKYLENTYSVTRRDIKSMIGDYFTSWNENYGEDGAMTYTIESVVKDDTAENMDELEEELKSDYNITVTIKESVTVKLTIHDGSSDNAEKATLVHIGSHWYCMEAMEQMDYIAEYDGYDEW